MTLQSPARAETQTASGAAMGVKVNSVAHALAILRRLATSDHPEGVNAIARKVGISPSSCFNILKTLAAEDFARFDVVDKTYTLGAGAIDLAVAGVRLSTSV